MPTTIPTTTSSTRPPSSAGDAYFETDTKNYIIYDGANWRAYNSDSAYGWTGGSVYSLDLDGTNDYATIGTNQLVNTGAAFSISFWMKIDSYPGGYPYIFTLKSDQSEAFIIGASDQTNYAGLFFGIPTNTDFSTNSSAVSNDLLSGWRHICLTFDGVSRTAASSYTLYINTTSTSFADTTGFSSVGNSSYVGTSSALTSFYDGKLDEVAIFGSELSSTEVNTIYNGGVAGADLSSFNPTSWWTMGDNVNGNGSVVTDQGSGGNSIDLKNEASFSVDVAS
jgi:hypothetical protein